MAALARPDAPTSALDVRKRIVEALELDLVGPPPDHELAGEMLPGWLRPSNWYLTGFLIPTDAPPEHSADEDADEDIEEVPESEGLAEESQEERSAARKGFFPSSMGVSTLVAATATVLTVTVRWGDYARADNTFGDEDGDGDDALTSAEADGAAGRPGSEPGDEAPKRRSSVWQRTPREQSIDVALGAGDGAPAVLPVPDSDGLELHILERTIEGASVDGRIPAGTRSVSLFLVNRRRPLGDENRDGAYAFQPELEVRCAQPFVPRPDLRGAQAAEPEDRVADLHYAGTPEYATGHGISAEWNLTGAECYVLRTRWIPRAQVEKTVPAQIDGVELRMVALGALADGAATEAALLPLVEAYRGWIEQQRGDAQALSGERRETADVLLHEAAVTASRIERGIAALASDPDALDAFRVANRAVASALRRRLGREDPSWRPFQLAFILLNLPGIADPADPHREIVDLLFFPTGGGKTEAYLGLAAFTMVLRRLRHPARTARRPAG